VHLHQLPRDLRLDRNHVERRTLAMEELRCN
jgi:hypothetical protein